MCVLVCVCIKCARKVDCVDVERAVAVAKNVPAVNQEVVRRVNFVPTVVIILDRCWPRHLKEGDARWMAGVLRIYCEHTVQRKGQQGTHGTWCWVAWQCIPLHCEYKYCGASLNHTELELVAARASNLLLDGKQLTEGGVGMSRRAPCQAVLLKHTPFPVMFTLPAQHFP